MFYNLKIISTIAVIFLLLINLSFTIAADSEIVPGSPTQCYFCEGINCQRTTKVNATVTCSDSLDICVTIFENLAVAAKGCYLDMPIEHRHKCDEHHNSECVKCFGQRCNNKGRSDIKCIECNSSDNSKCSYDTSDITPTPCAIPTAPNSYCYVRHGGNNVRRGCFVHQQDQMDCMKDQMCAMCLSDNAEACNTDAVMRASVSRSAMLNLNAMLILLLIIFLR